jgi:hypothetical protein
MEQGSCLGASHRLLLRPCQPPLKGERSEGDWVDRFDGLESKSPDCLDCGLILQLPRG